MLTFGALELWYVFLICSVGQALTGAQIWELVEGKPLFRGGPYSKAAHLAQMVAMFGLPKPEFLHGSTAMAEFASVFFTRGNKVFRGVGNADWNVFKGRRLERMERRYRGAEKEHFLRFMKSMLVWYRKWLHRIFSD